VGATLNTDAFPGIEASMLPLTEALCASVTVAPRDCESRKDYFTDATGDRKLGLTGIAAQDFVLVSVTGIKWTDIEVVRCCHTLVLRKNATRELTGERDVHCTDGLTHVGYRQRKQET